MPTKVTIPKTGRQTVDSTPLEAPDSAVVFEKPVKGRKKTPKSDKATVGSKSSASDSSSDFGSSIKGIPGTSIRSIGAPDTEEEIQEWENLNILTPYNKSQDKFQDMLASLTRSDAHHDLKKVFNETAYKEIGIKRAFDNGIPKPATESFHEGEAFAAVVSSAADAQGTSIEINGNEDKLLATENVCVSKTQIKKSEQSFGHIINKYTKLDPTLPRINNILCPNPDCQTNTEDHPRQIIYIRYDDINMKYVYLCVHCDTTWKTDNR